MSCSCYDLSRQVRSGEVRLQPPGAARAGSIAEKTKLGQMEFTISVCNSTNSE